MQLGRVVGVVVPCVVTPGLEGVPMLLLQPLDGSRKPRGKTLVAADPTRMAGPGELVYYEGGCEAALRALAHLRRRRGRALPRPWRVRSWLRSHEVAGLPRGAPRFAQCIAARSRSLVRHPG